MLFRPAFDDDFLFGIKLDSVAPLPVHDAEEAVFPAAKGKVGHGRGDSDINANVSRRSFVAESASRRTAGGKQRSLIPVGAALQKREGVVEIIGVDEAENR